MCNFNFGTWSSLPKASNGAHYDVTISGVNYLIQEMFEVLVSKPVGGIYYPGSCAVINGAYPALRTPIVKASPGDFYYLDTNGHAREMTVVNGTWQIWGNYDVTASSGAASAGAGSSLIGYHDSSGRTYVLYVTAAQHLETVYYNGSAWLSQDLTDTF